MKRKQVLALLLAVAMTANMTMPAYAASAPVSGSIFWGSQETAAITEEDLAAAMAAAVKGTDEVSEGAEKEETVYVFTDAYGKQKSMTVSNWLKNKEGSDKLYDNSILQNIENVKGDEPFTQNGDTRQLLSHRRSPITLTVRRSPRRIWPERAARSKSTSITIIPRNTVTSSCLSPR